MQFKLPKDDAKYKWTNHVKDKMLYYGISEGLIKRIVRFPRRKEEGVAPRTIAVMQPRTIASRSRGKPTKRIEEIWVMYQELGLRPSPDNLQFTINNLPRIRIISAWRYPGVSPVGRKIPIPDDIRQELEGLIG